MSRLVAAWLVALAACPLACAESNHATSAPPAARPAVRADEPQAAAASPRPDAVIAADPGGALYNPFARTARADEQAHVASAVAPQADDASPIAAILTAIGCLAALAYLLRRVVIGF